MNFGMLIGATDNSFSLLTVRRRMAPLIVGKGFQILEGEVSFRPDNGHQAENHLADNGSMGNIGFI